VGVFYVLPALHVALLLRLLPSLLLNLWLLFLSLLPKPLHLLPKLLLLSLPPKLRL